MLKLKYNTSIFVMLYLNINNTLRISMINTKKIEL